MKRTKFLKKSIIVTLGIGATVASVIAIAASCNNKKSNKQKVIDYMENKIKEILSQNTSNNSSENKEIEKAMDSLRLTFSTQIDNILKTSGKSDLTDEEYNNFVNAMDNAFNSLKQKNS